MNILEFIQYAGAKVKTAADNDVTITNIVPDDKYPIKGTYYHEASKTVNSCEWDEDGYPHKLPTTNGLNLLPYLPSYTWHRIDSSKFNSAESYAELVHKST